MTQRTVAQIGCAILAELMDGPKTVSHLCLVAHEASVTRWMRQLHQDGLVYISSWHRVGKQRRWARVFSLQPSVNEMPDQPCPVNEEYRRERAPARQPAVHLKPAVKPMPARPAANWMTGL